ncbi:hypothetical protein EDD85DRAFT_1027060 [Armillaria nabsnona]|nr:hypothetical protein EDD85DRAFT_1027060 [Armillaria nabsnona]
MSSQVPVLHVEIIELILATLWSSSDLNVRERLLFMKSPLYVCQTWYFTFLRISLADVHILSTPYLVYILRLLDKVFTGELAVYLASHCPCTQDILGKTFFKSLPHVRRVTLLYHNVSTFSPFVPTWCFNLVFTPNVSISTCFSHTKSLSIKNRSIDSIQRIIVTGQSFTRQTPPIG